MAFDNSLHMSNINPAIGRNGRRKIISAYNDGDKKKLEIMIQVHRRIFIAQECLERKFIFVGNAERVDKEMPFFLSPLSLWNWLHSTTANIMYSRSDSIDLSV